MLVLTLGHALGRESGGLGTAAQVLIGPCADREAAEQVAREAARTYCCWLGALAYAVASLACRSEYKRVAAGC